MIKRYILFILLTALEVILQIWGKNLFAQDYFKIPKDSGWIELEPDFKHSLPILKIFGGGLMYIGDLQNEENFRRYWGFRPAFGGGVDQRFGKWFGLSANFTYGWVASERKTLQEFVNFRSRIINVDIRTMFHLDYLLMKKQLVSPYVSCGLGYINFKTFSDLKDANGQTYYLWNDGQLRNQPQNQTQQGFPEVLKRDYTFETDITPSKNNFINFPVSIGFQFKMHRYWNYYLESNYFFTLSKFTESSLQRRRDSYFFLNTGIRFFISQFDNGAYELRIIREKYKNALR